MKGGHNVSDPKLVKVLADNAPSALLWLEGMGLKFNPKVGAATGALHQRSHYPNPAGGNTYVVTLENNWLSTVLIESKYFWKLRLPNSS